MENVESYRVLIIGDFHYGESYTRAGAPMLKEHGYPHSTAHLRPFIDASDSFIINLETPLTDPAGSTNPLVGKKPYIHWANPVGSGEALKDLGVDAVSLANNHMLDQGERGLESTFQTLSRLGIDWFGAGRTLEESRAPYQLRLPDRVGGGEIHLHGSFQYSVRHDRDFGFYADENSPGCAPLKVSEVPAARNEATSSDTFQVAFPHWGANYAWRTEGQYRLAHRFIKKDYDLILGHGAHSLQEVHRKQQRWVVYGLGNGVFNSGGRWRRYEDEHGILPFSFWAMLEVNRQGEHRWLTLKLYPVYSDNSSTSFQPQPVSGEDFSRVLSTLASRPARPWRFDNPAQGAGLDELGHYLSLDLGEWARREKPSLLENENGGSDPSDWPLRSPGIEIEDKILRLNKFLGTSILAIGAQNAGGVTRWISSRIAVIERGDRRLIAQSYRVHESSLGAAIVKDKVLAAQLLESAGVSTPKTVLVNSSAQAVSAAANIPGPVVIKPRDGRKSRGVSTGLYAEHEVREAFEIARKHGREILVQEHIEVEEELRVMASTQHVVAVNGRVLPHIVGDGRSTVQQLVSDKNLQRTLNPSLMNRPIPIDSLTHRQLERNGQSLDYVPEYGETVTVRGVAGLSVGGDTNQVLEQSDLSVKETAASAVAAIPGLEWGGVDLIIERHTGKPYVIEINTEASYGAALFPAYGRPRDVAAEVWKLRYEATAPEVTAAAEVCSRNRRTSPIIRNRSFDGTNGEAYFGEMFQDALTRQEFGVDRMNPRVLVVSDSHGDRSWVTTGGLTGADRSVVGIVMKRHHWVRELMRLKDIPQPRARSVSSLNQLRAFVEGRVGQVVIAPPSAPWASGKSQCLTESEVLAMKTLANRMWVQARPLGVRLRVLATRFKSWVVATDLEKPQISRSDLDAAQRMAVQAIRAVPELQWASVDILVRPNRIRQGRTGGLLVEGITRAPVFDINDQVIAGDFDAFCRAIIEGGQFSSEDQLANVPRA